MCHEPIAHKFRIHQYDKYTFSRNASSIDHTSKKHTKRD